MSIEYDGGLARLAGDCRVEDAGDLAEWLCVTAGARVDLRQAGHLHAAVLQTLMALRPAIVDTHSDPHVAEWLAGLPAAAPGDAQASEASA